MRTLEDKLQDLDTAAEHLGRAYDLLWACGYRGLANAVLELIDETSEELADIEMDLDEQDEDYLDSPAHLEQVR